MAQFLSAEWCAQVNDRLTSSTLPPVTEAHYVVLALTNGPSTAAHALTVAVTPQGASVQLGDHLAADTMLRLTYDDALAISEGTLSSAAALREGRLKVSGDLTVVVAIAPWLAALFGEDVSAD